MSTEPRGKVFLTYDSGMTKDDSDKILKDVIHIFKNAEKQGFSVSMDSYGPAHNDSVRHAIAKNFEEVCAFFSVPQNFYLKKKYFEFWKYYSRSDPLCWKSRSCRAYRIVCLLWSLTKTSVLRLFTVCINLIGPGRLRTCSFWIPPKLTSLLHTHTLTDYGYCSDNVMTVRACIYPQLRRMIVFMWSAAGALCTDLHLADVLLAGERSEPAASAHLYQQRSPHLQTHAEGV